MKVLSNWEPLWISVVAGRLARTWVETDWHHHKETCTVAILFMMKCLTPTARSFMHGKNTCQKEPREGRVESVCSAIYLAFLSVVRHEKAKKKRKCRKKATNRITGLKVKAPSFRQLNSLYSSFSTDSGGDKVNIGKKQRSLSTYICKAEKHLAEITPWPDHRPIKIATHFVHCYVRKYASQEDPFVMSSRSQLALTIWENAFH